LCPVKPSLVARRREARHPVRFLVSLYGFHQVSF
jgi:hypothetical protein